MVTIDFKLAELKLEISEAYLLKLGENLSLENCGFFLIHADISNAYIPTRK